MVLRALTAAAALWVAGFLLLYGVIVSGQGGSPAWWFVALLGLALALLLAVLGGATRGLLVMAGVLLAASVVAGLASIGLLLVPALLAVIVAGVVRPPDGRVRTGRVRT